MATAIDVPQTAATPKVRRRRTANGATRAASTPAAKSGSKSVCKYAWTQAGALIGLAICAADQLLEWRGVQVEAWDNIAGFSHNITHVGATVLLIALVGFIAGAINDAIGGKTRSVGKPRRKHAGRAKTSRPAADLRGVNMLAMHWRGELPLWVSYWIVGVIGGLAVSFVPAAAVAVFRADSSYGPASVLSVSAAVWIAVFAVATWQAVGVWRSATRYVAEHLSRPARKESAGKESASMDEAELAPLWGWLARFAAIIGLASLVATFGTEWLPQLGELYRIVLYDDPDIPPYSITVNGNGTEVEIAGGFKYGLADDFTAVINNTPHLKVVHLDSDGGRLGEAERLFTLVRERGLSTYVSSKCFSACTLAFAGGRERVLKRGAALGFHKAEFPGVSEDEFDSLQERVFSAAGFDRRFIDRALATPHKDLWTPAPDVLIAARVITALTDGTKSSRLPQAENTTQPRHPVASN